MAPDATSPPLLGPAGAALRDLFGPAVIVALARPQSVDALLFDEERRYIARAVAQRRAEFGTARVLARQALASLGVTAVPLVPNADRSPAWPPGVCGTISHTRTCCAVAVTDAPQISGIGLDIEADTPLDPGLEAAICTLAERRFLDRWRGLQRGRLAKLIFCAKEAFYKCQYGTTKTLIGFDEVTLEIALEDRSYRVACLDRRGPAWRRVQACRGRFCFAEGLVAAAAIL